MVYYKLTLIKEFFNNKEKTITISNYLQMLHPEYEYLQIIPHKSLRNYKGDTIIATIADTYKTLIHRIHKENKQWFIETNVKISYVMDIQEKNTSFYLLVPTYYKNLVMTKIADTWGECTINEIDDLESIDKDCNYYSLYYKKNDCLSLKVDKRSNAPLNQILNVANIMQDDDKIRIVYNFMPTSQSNFYESYNQMIDKFNAGEILDKKANDFDYWMKIFFNTAMKILDGIVEVFSDFLGADDQQENIFKTWMNYLNKSNQKVLSTATTNKKDSTVINTQILVMSASSNVRRKLNNGVAVCDSYTVLKEDNQLIYKKIKIKKERFDLKNFDLGTQKSLLSTDECCNFMQLPANELLKAHNIKYIQVEEAQLPAQLSSGTKRIGTVTYKGIKQSAYLENEYDIGNLPLLIVGRQGSGKSTYMENYSSDCIKAKEGLIILDFIKNCEFSESIKPLVPKDKLIEIDLSKESDLQGLGYNEIQITNDMSAYNKCKYANLQAQQVMSLIDAISTGEPLSGRMRRFLYSSANIVFTLGLNSIKNVIDCLQNYKFRADCINSLDDNLTELLSDEITNLEELNEYNKTSGELCGNKDSKIEFILDRISLLREDFKFKYMYNKKLDNNINLVDTMNAGKVVFIKMKESEFPTKIQKNVMITYWITKIWLACQLRGDNKPLRNNVIIDEVFQAPTSMNMLYDILPQSRKFGLKFTFSAQYTKQVDKIFDSLEGSGSSFMLLTGSTEGDFNYFKNKLDNFEFDDLKNMDKYSALNLVTYSKGYSSFITKLPAPLDSHKR